jgi:hypothetical protein
MANPAWRWHALGMHVAERITVSVDSNGRGSWEVALSGGRERIECDSLDDAKRVARVCATREGLCDLVVRDAYHRVLTHELLLDQERPSQILVSR